MIVLERKRYEQQLNGKFIKCKRDDDITEYKSRWIYSFNVTNENMEVTIGIHQPSLNYGLINSYLHAGLVVLRSNMSMLTFVDYIPMKETRQSFIKLKLLRGSYVVVPV